MDVFERWDATDDTELTLELINEFFDTITEEDVIYGVSAAVDRTLDDLALQRAILERGISLTDSSVERAKADRSAALLLQAAETESGDAPASPASLLDDSLVRLLGLRAILLRRKERLQVYQILSSDPTWLSEPYDEAETPEVLEDGEEEDPWADEAVETPSPSLSPQSTINLSEFITSNLPSSSIQLARKCRFGSLNILLKQHALSLFPFRLSILDAIPLHVHPSKITSLLPSFNPTIGTELPPTSVSPEDVDWVDTPEGIESYLPHLPADLSEILDHTFKGLIRLDEPMSVTQLCDWYKARVEAIDSDTGLIDIGLAMVQHGASQGIPGLDELGEELSLLARLVYDTPNPTRGDDVIEWTLSRWRSTDSHAIVNGYLAHSTPPTIASDIRHLVLPYLFVLEARAERAGIPDHTLHTRFLHDYILSAPLSLCLAIFNASKPTTPTPQRIVRSDEDLARLALARLYGSSELDEWATMSSIFECLPEWPAPSEDDETDGISSAETTLVSLSAFCQPSVARGRAAPPASELYLFFVPLPAPALSRTLDILDVHLECGEIMSRWGVPVALGWFLQSSHDAKQQRAWATRMVRKMGAGSGVEDGLGDDGVYTELLKDMLKLVGPEGSKDTMGAFRLLEREEVMCIFFSGVLTSGKFELAKRLLRNNHHLRKLKPNKVEELCLSASREFYDNASGGNLHSEDMKLAYDCLSVPPSSPTIITERSFIEATSKICSYHITSRPGILITPLEIRLVKDRLTLIARILSENEHAYQHPDVILDLVEQLGYKIGKGPEGDVASEAKVLAMLADSAIQNEDFETAAGLCERMVKLLGPVSLDTASNAATTATTPIASSSSVQTSISEATELAWHTAFQLGRQSEFHDVKRKMLLLGYALQLCPRENTLAVLSVWRRVEQESLNARKEGEPRGRQRHAAGASAKKKKHSSSLKDSILGSAGGGLLSAALSSHTTLSDYASSATSHGAPAMLLNQGADAAALAAKTFGRVAANFPLSLRGMRERLDSDGAGSPSSARSASPDVGSHARQALARGMGWLIGEDE